MVTHLCCLFLSDLGLLLRELLIALYRVELFQASAAKKALAARVSVIKAKANVSAPTVLAPKRGVLELIRVQGKVLRTKELMARDTLQRTHEAALSAESRSH